MADLGKGEESLPLTVFHGLNNMQPKQHNLKRIKSQTQKLKWSVAWPLSFERDLLFFMIIIFIGKALKYCFAKACSLSLSCIGRDLPF